MASASFSNYKPTDAFEYAKRYIKNMPLDTVQLRILDAVSKMMWMAAPWRWTLAAMPQITLVASTQDYTLTLPADFLYAESAYVTDQAGGNPRDLSIEPFLPTGGLVGQPSRIAFTGVPGTANGGTARLFPTPGTQPSPTPRVISTYKKWAPTLTLANINTGGALQFDDEWAFVYESGVLWLAYLYADDARAGTSQYGNNGTFTFSGQRAVFEANLQLMREREKLPIIDPRLIPDPKQRQG